MRIGLSGLGGSGKSTYLSELQGRFRKKGISFKTVVLRDRFLWTRVAQKARGDRAAEVKSSIKKERSLSRDTLRLGFFFLDSWRIHLAGSFSKAELVLFDRYFYDFFVELFLANRRLLKFKWVLKFLPRPDANIFFRASAATVFDRKYEFELEVIKEQEEMYALVYGYLQQNGINVLPIDAEMGIEEIVACLEYLVMDPRRPFLFSSLFSQESAPLLPVVSADVDAFLELAKMNRCVWGFVEYCRGHNLKNEKIDRALEKGRSMVGEQSISLERLEVFKKDVGVHFQVLKSGGGVELGTDVDVVFRKEADLQKACDYWAHQGEVRKISAKKAEVAFKEGYDLDLHVGMEFGGFEYVSGDFCLEHPAEAEALVLMAHSLNELTLVTLGDILKIRNIFKGGCDLELMEKEARAHGWLPALHWWLGIYRNAMHYELPLRIPLGVLVPMKLRKQFGHRGPVLRDWYDLARAIRARRMGRIPFHEPWLM